MSHEELSSRERELLRSIEELYAVFRRYRLVGPMDADPRFPGVCDERPLGAAPLDQLPPEAFKTYQMKAMTTWGTLRDFKHFLPRMLEIIGTSARSDPFGELDPFFIFGKLDYASWTSWLADERSAVDSYFNALWSVLLLSPDEGSWAWPISRWLRDLSSVRGALTPLLHQWEADLADLSRGPTPAFHLARLVEDEGQDFLSPRSRRGFQHGHLGHVLEWLVSDSIGQRLMDAFFAWHDMPGAEALSEAYERQQMCRQLVDNLRRNGEW